MFAFNGPTFTDLLTSTGVLCVCSGGVGVDGQHEQTKNRREKIRGDKTDGGGRERSAGN